LRCEGNIRDPFKSDEIDIAVGNVVLDDEGGTDFTELAVVFFAEIANYFALPL
jgi:hypothetical protein